MPYLHQPSLQYVHICFFGVLLINVTQAGHLQEKRHALQPACKPQGVIFLRPARHQACADELLVWSL